MSATAIVNRRAKVYAFRFDSPLERVIVGGRVNLHGWLLHREGKPIHGIRTLAKRRFRKPQILRGRRKRKRPDVAEAFPDLPGSEDSGFLLELELGFGENELEFQVLDEERRWLTFAAARVYSVPLRTLQRAGLTNVREFFIRRLPHMFSEAPRSAATAQVSLGTTRSETAPALTIKRVELFATTKSNLFITELGELVAAGFRELGVDAQLLLDEVPAANPPRDVVQIVVTPHEYYNLFLTEKLSLSGAQELTRAVYLLCTEQPETGWFESNLRWGAHSLGVTDINPLGIAAYRARNLDAQQLQLGYHPMLRAERDLAHAARRCEITFLGSMTERRERFFARHGDFFAAHRCHIRLVPLGFAKTKTTRSYLPAARRNELLSDSRILLNVHYSEQKYFEWHRMLIGLANGCCIISEPCKGYGALIPGKHFVMVEPEYLVPACEYYLAHPEECEAIALAGRKFIETELRQAQGCRSFLEGIEARQEAVPPFLSDASAAPLSSGLKRQLSRHTVRLFGQAVKSDLDRSRKADRISLAHEENVTPPNAASEAEMRRQVIAKREGYRARLAAQQQADARGESVAQFHDNDAYARTAKPALSVVITLFNYGDHLEECVASASAAAARLSAAAEIVIVNDASTDDSLARALDCQRRTVLPMRIVDKKFNTGLADARNTGIRTARAPYIFMLDADNVVFPEAFRQLHDVISSGDYAAAFSLLCRFRGTPDNRIGLLSYYDWDPEILVQHPYIDAMAMFSRDALLELGGYDNELNQIGWFGWEDYDMWLRFAQRERRVGFVPNTLCLYRYHETSMINSTNLFELDLVRHFVGRFADLLERFEPRATAFGVDRSKLQAE